MRNSDAAKWAGPHATVTQDLVRRTVKDDLVAAEVPDSRQRLLDDVDGVILVAQDEGGRGREKAPAEYKRNGGQPVAIPVETEKQRHRL